MTKEQLRILKDINDVAKRQNNLQKALTAIKLEIEEIEKVRIQKVKELDALEEKL